MIGTRSNRDGIGAMVTAVVGSRTERTRVRSGSSYLSQSDLRAHFGLSGQKSADVEILWPSGTIDRLKNVKADRIVTVREGSGRLE